LNPTIQLPPPPVFNKPSVNKNEENNVIVNLDYHDKRDRYIIPSSLNNNSTQHQPNDSVDQEESKLRPAYEEAMNISERIGQIGVENNFGKSPSADAISDHNQKAKVLVNEMIQAVQLLGGAAARGELPGAIKQQGLELVDRLRGFREQDNLEDVLRVMQQIGKVGVESLQSAQNFMLPKPNVTKIGKKKTVYIRVGRIIIDGMRIFAKDSWIDTTKKNAYNKPEKINTGNGKEGNGHNGRWNKPIYIERLILRSSELSPSISMTDKNNLPAIYHSVDKVVEAVTRRLLVEIAKSNTGKLFSTALGEVLSVMVANPNQPLPASST